MDVVYMCRLSAHHGDIWNIGLSKLTYMGAEVMGRAGLAGRQGINIAQEPP